MCTRYTPCHRRRGKAASGRCSEPLRLDRFATAAKSVFLASQIQVVGEPAATVRHIAIACGAGGDFISDAIRKQADVFLTGELRFHDCLAAKAQGLKLVLPGHHATERIGVEDLARNFRLNFPTCAYGLATASKIRSGIAENGTSWGLAEESLQDRSSWIGLATLSTMRMGRPMFD